MLDFSIIYGTEITIKSLNAYANAVPIVPPDPMNCTAGLRPYSRFYYVTSGETIFNKGTPKELHGRCGDIIYLPHDVTYVSEWSSGELGSFLTVNFIINDESIVFSDDICIAAVDTSGRYLRLFRELNDIWTKGSYDSRLRALAVFSELLVMLSEDNSRSALRSNYGAISDGIMYIENHFWEEFSVEDLSRMCAVSPATFRRQFKAYSDYSPITYRNYLRIKRAESLLESGEYTVTEASLAVGFSDLSYFNRTFRKFFGKNPSDVKGL